MYEGGAGSACTLLKSVKSIRQYDPSKRRITHNLSFVSHSFAGSIPSKNTIAKSFPESLFFQFPPRRTIGSDKGYTHKALPRFCQQIDYQRDKFIVDNRLIQNKRNV